MSSLNPLKINKVITPLPKPDNSDAKCNLVVKGLQPNKREQSLENYFSEKYGAVKSCKIAKDSNSGNSLGYGFVWFEREIDASAAMEDFKKGNSKYTIDWYKQRDFRQAQLLNKKILVFSWQEQAVRLNLGML